MTRDSWYWWVGLIGGALTAISSRLDLLDLVLPIQHREKVHAMIEIISVLVSAVSGFLMTSPLPGEHDGERLRRRTDLRGDVHGGG